MGKGEVGGILPFTNFCLVCQAMKTCFAINTGKHTFIEFNNSGDSGETGGEGG